MCLGLLTDGLADVSAAFTLACVDTGGLISLAIHRIASETMVPRRDVPNPDPDEIDLVRGREHNVNLYRCGKNTLMKYRGGGPFCSSSVADSE